MQDGCAAERIGRQEDYQNMEETMSAKMDGGLRSKQQARHQAQNEIMEGLKNEEYARQLVPSDLAVMKGVIGLLEVVKEEQKNVSYKIREQEVTARLKMSECPQETLGESARPVLQGTRSHGRRRIQDQRGAR